MRQPGTHHGQALRINRDHRQFGVGGLGGISVTISAFGKHVPPTAGHFVIRPARDDIRPIADNDVISDNGAEVYSYLKQRGIKYLLIMGVHTNMCVLGRSFAIRQMTRWGIRCILVRDLTDSMYNPKKSPFVSHDQGTELVIQHIEKYWCPSIQSSDLLAQATKP